MTTQADRNKASRIRRAIAKGKTVSPERVQWLAEYDARKQRGGRPVVHTPPAAPEPAQCEEVRPAPALQRPAVPRPAETSHESPAGGQHAAASRESVESGFLPLIFDDSSAPDSAPDNAPNSAPDSTPSACPIQDCPECRKLVGAAVCGQTGKHVWPPMAKESAQVLASAILAFIAIAARFMRKDGHFVAPNARDRALATEAVRALQRERFTGIGANNDIMLAIAALTSFGSRAMTEKPPEKAAK